MKPGLLSLTFFLAVFTFSFAQDYKSYDEGILKFKAQDYQAVIDLFTKVLAQPDHNKRLNQDLYFYRGQSNYHVGEFDAALSDLDESLALNHFNKAVIYWYKARCMDKKGKTEEAEKLYAEALTFAEKNKKVSAQIFADRATYYSRRGRNDAAQSDIAMARSLDPSSHVVVPETKSAAVKETPGQEQKNTKVIVKNNPNSSGSAPAAQKETAKPSSTNSKPVTQQAESQNSSASLVASLADIYKDEQRYALVIGNSNYPKEMGFLKNPVNDATDVATELRRSEFEVQLLTNATYIQIREAMRKFQEKLINGPKDQTVGLFYYAGHGVQFQDENYLVPIDANVKFEDDIVRMCFPVQRMVLNNMEKTNSRMNIIILDACRNNPFPATSRGVSQGLGEMKRARGSFIAYATAPGSVASDGVGRNGLYTQELLKALRKPGLTIEQVFKEVRMNVLKLSDDRQYTWDSSNIIGEFYFKF
jgi:tetratricopeptide (TPR) repeat protein